MNKKAKLILANIIGFLIVVMCFFLAGVMHELGYWSLMFIVSFWLCFIFLSLIIYYLSIIADALNKRYKEREEKDGKK